MRLILYSKPGCHLCEGLQTKLEQVNSLKLELEVRDITSREDWFQTYQYEIPVLIAVKGVAKTGDAGELSEVQNLEPIPILIPLPRLSPRATVQQVEQMLQKYRLDHGSE
jgi:hypothetical protein